MKVYGTLEFRLGALSLGMTSTYYMDGYFENSNLVYNQFVFAGNNENRLQNTFNFSLGGEKGSSFSGSVTYATVENVESPGNLITGEKYPTTAKIMGAVISYAFAF